MLKVVKSSTKVIFIIISVADPKLHYVPNIWHKLQKCQKRGGTVKFEVCMYNSTCMSWGSLDIADLLIYLIEMFLFICII